MRIPITLFLLLLLLTGCGEERQYSMDKAEVNAFVMADGRMYVEEMFTYTFHGVFHGTQRYLEHQAGRNIEFFEAYIPPEGKQLGSFSYEKLNRLKVEFNEDNETYYAYQDAQDETKRVFYRYLVDHAATRYEETGELDWEFFKNNNQNIQDVSINITLPRVDRASNAYAFLHDKTGGQITATDPYIHYENSNLSEYGTAGMRILFPSDFLSDMRVEQGGEGWDQAIAGEQGLQNRLAERSARLNMAEKPLDAASLLVTAAGVVILFGRLKITAWWSRKQALRELEQMDPVTVAYLYRKGKLKPKDIIAGLFSLRQRGLATAERGPATARFQNDPRAPKETVTFVFKGDPNSLPAADRQLIQWLFTRYGNVYRCRIDSLAGPTDTERKQRKRETYYKRRSEQFKEEFQEWKELVQAADTHSQYVRESRLNRLWVRFLVLVHWMACVYLYFADSAGGLAMSLVILIAGSAAVWAWFVPARKMILFFFLLVCFIMGAQLSDGPGSASYILFVCSTALLFAVLPGASLSWEAACYQYAMKTWRRMLKRGTFDPVHDGNRLGRLAEYAVLLDVGTRFVKAAVPYSTVGETESSAYLLNASSAAALVYSQNNVYYKPYPPAGSGSDSGSYSSGGGDSGGGDGGTGAF